MLSLAKTHLFGKSLIFRKEAEDTFGVMLNSILAICRAVFLILGGDKQVALENIALRQQLGIFQRSVRRPKIRPLDRLFWVCLRKVWKEWKSALEFVQPKTVVD